MSLLTNPLVSGALRARTLGVLLAAASLILPGVVLAQPSGPNGIPVCTANNDQVTPAIVPDGSGGSIIAWQDCRSGNYDIYAQRANADGVVLWTFGRCSYLHGGQQPTATSDRGRRQRGAIIAWQDSATVTGTSTRNA